MTTTSPYDCPREGAPGHCTLCDLRLVRAENAMLHAALAAAQAALALAQAQRDGESSVSDDGRFEDPGDR